MHRASGAGNWPLWQAAIRKARPGGHLRLSSADGRVHQRRWLLIEILAAFMDPGEAIPDDGSLEQSTSWSV